MVDETLPDWVKVHKKRFDSIQNKVKMFKKEIVVPRGSGDCINATSSYRLIQDIENTKITHEEALKGIFKILNDIERLEGLEEINPNQVGMLNILFIKDEIFTGIHSEYKNGDNQYAFFITKIDEKELGIVTQKSDEQPDTTDIPDSESEGSVAQRRNQQGQGLKILTPNQMFSRSPNSLAQLNARNNSEKLKNEIRQLLYSLCRSKKFTK